MGLDDKIRNTADKATGETKEKVGDARNDHDQQAEGKAQSGKADLKQAGENVKDAFKH